MTMRESFAHYEIISKIGSGGMGEVFLAMDTRLGRRIAIKFLSASYAANADRLARFVQEAKAASALNHPNIITVYEIGETDGDHFMAVEFVDGKTLRERITDGKMSFDEVLSIAIQTAEALAAAHDAGIIHRDIKPENVMVRNDGYVKVLDFGLAKLADGRSQATAPGALAENITVKFVKTNPGVVMGTAAYMSPEQARGKETDVRTDLFSFGSVLYEILAGTLPFSGETNMDVFAAVINADPKPLELLAPELPEELNRIVGKLLRKDPDDRYASARELAGDLKELRSELQLDAKLERTASPNRRETSERRMTTITGGVKDALLLTEFENLTGEEIFDQTLKTALAFSLAQSPFLDVVSDIKVSQTLKLMGRSPVERVTKLLGEELCLRMNLKAYLMPGISSFGSVYIITLEAINAGTGESLGKEMAQANTREEILNAVGKVASGMREKLGESLSSIEKFNRPLDYTSSSLEALKLFSLARDQQFKGKQLEAVPFFKKALEIDPGFAQGYVSLAATYGNTDQWNLASEMMRLAFDLRDSVSEIEKLRITYFYYLYVTGELEKAIVALEEWRSTYPLDHIPLIGLSDIYEKIGQSEKAVKVAREALRLDPDYATGYVNLAEPQMSLGRFGEVKQTCKNAFDRKCDSYYFHQFLFKTAFVENDVDAMRENLRWFGGRNDEYLALDLEASAAGFRGQWRAEQELSRRAIELATRNEAKEVAAQFVAEHALRVVFWSSSSGIPGHDTTQLLAILKTETNNALKLVRGKEVVTRAALAMAFAGQAGYAGWLADELLSERPNDTFLGELWMPLIRAAGRIYESKYREAVSELESTRRFESAAEFLPQYLRGLAFLGSGQNEMAKAEFDRIMESRGEAPLSAVYPLAQLGKARATRQLDEYEKFFELWREADLDMPALKAARAEATAIAA